jgi:uncharacterized protein YjbJ (UPF0337 family)
MLNKDEVSGKAEQLKGKVKEGVGNLAGDERLRQEGLDDQDAGAVQEAAGTARRKVGEAVEKVGNAIKK